MAPWWSPVVGAGASSSLPGTAMARRRTYVLLVRTHQNKNVGWHDTVAYFSWHFNLLRAWLCALMRMRGDGEFVPAALTSQWSILGSTSSTILQVEEAPAIQDLVMQLIFVSFLITRCKKLMTLSMGC